MQYIARQPILDADRHLQAYELLFRNSLENRCTEDDLETASKKTMDTAVLYGLDALSGGLPVFLNFTHDLLVEEFPTLFPAQTTVIEVLESAHPSEALVQACETLKQAGYRIALDDFVPQPGYEPLIELADILKIDVRSTSTEERANLAAKYGARDRQLLAEKVETEEEFRSSIDLGFTLFQGYYFSRPNVISTPAVDRFDANQLRIMRLLSNPKLDFREIERVIKLDPALCHRLLRFLNSPSFYLHSEVRSILHALTLLGEQETRKWLLVASAVLGLRSGNEHLLSMMLVRARFAELLGPQVRLPGSSLFLLGMLSLMDVVLNVPRETLAEQVAVSGEIRRALKGESNDLGRCLELVTAFESADWTSCERLRESWGISSQDLSAMYVEAVRWAKQALD